MERIYIIRKIKLPATSKDYSTLRVVYTGDVLPNDLRVCRNFVLHFGKKNVILKHVFARW